MCALDPVTPSCRQSITGADLATLLYVQGLDINLCTKFQSIASLSQLRDCAGNLIAPNAEVVLCSDFAAQLCSALSALATGGSLVLGSTLVVGADCQTYTVPETPLVVNDSTCIDLTASGTFGHTLTASLVISPDAGNQAECLANGLFVPPAADICTELAGLAFNGVAVPGVTKIIAQDCRTYDLPAGASSIVVQGGDRDCIDVSVVEAPAGTFTITADPVISPNLGNAISCISNGLFVPEVQIFSQDTACIDIEIVDGGNGDWVITVDPIISGAEGNILECTPEGLYVPTPETIDVSITAVDTNCLDLTVTEPTPNNFVLTGSPIISPVVGNALACSALGLFVLPGAPGDPVVINGIDTNCIDITVDNPVANQWDITVTPVIDPSVDNILECGVDGLFVPASASFALSAVDTNCINTTVTPTGPDSATVQSNPIIANTYPGYPADCNPLLCTASGLAVPPDHTSLNFEVGVITHQIGAMAEGALRFMNDVVVDITNPSDCRSMAFSIVTRIPELLVELISPNNNRSHTRYTIVHDFNFPTATPPVVIPSVEKTRAYVWMTDVQTGDLPEQRQNGLPGGSIINLITLPPGASGTYLVSGSVQQLLGNADNVDNAGLVVRVSGSTI
jgi:hypothetical protein